MDRTDLRTAGSHTCTACAGRNGWMVGGMSTTGACQPGGFPIGGITVADDDRTLSPLRGRESEWHRITDLFHRAGRGHRSILVIEGPSGSGRTRLLGEL